MSSDAWDPEQYERFARERSQPFYDLLGLVHPVPGGSVVDLGCGTGSLTADLHRHTRAATTVGIDNSEAMLAEAGSHEGDGLHFELGDIGDLAGGPYDVVFANASLHWVPGHAALLTKLTEAVAPGGQLAVQVPANRDHPSHVAAFEVVAEEPFAGAIGSELPADMIWNVLPPEHYAPLLHELGYLEQHVRLQVYGHLLPETASVVEWTKGTMLVPFRRHLPAELFDEFLARYRDRVVAMLGHHAPYFYPFKRILMWARRP